MYKWPCNVYSRALNTSHFVKSQRRIFSSTRIPSYESNSRVRSKRGRFTLKNQFLEGKIRSKFVGLSREQWKFDASRPAEKISAGRFLLRRKRRCVRANAANTMLSGSTGLCVRGCEQHVYADWCSCTETERIPTKTNPLRAK